MSADISNVRLAEAARFAVLSRLMPALRHDVAGAMQPGRMLLMVLEKRLQHAEPDLQAIRATVASFSALNKQATASCMAALGWMASAEDAHVSLRSFVDEAIGLLAVELSVKGLTLINDITDSTAAAPQSFLRSVLVGALLAFCDQHVEGGTLQVSFEAEDAKPGSSGLVQLRTVAGSGVNTALHEAVRKHRLIDWPDVQAMARSSGVQMARGNSWLTLSLPRS